MKNKFLLAIISFFTLISVDCAERQKAGIPEEVKTGLRQDAKQFMESLKTVLIMEMQTNGIKAAVSVCSDTAQAMTTKYGAEKDIYIKRVSFKNRNTANVPDEFESRGLKYFEELKREGRLDESAELFEIDVTNGKSIVRFMKPIVVQAPCLSCHGPAESIGADVKAVLDKKYPGDKATGYQPGDLRGAVSVRKDL